MRFILTTIGLIFFTPFLFGQIVGDQMDFFSYKYDKELISRNRIETITAKSFFSDGQNIGKTIFYFDKQGLLTKQLVIDKTDVPQREFYFFTNSHLDLVLRIEKDFVFKKTDSVIFFKSYDGNRLTTDSSSQLPIKYNFEYDKNGKLFKTTIISNFGSDNNNKRIILNKTDHSGRVINIVETYYQDNKDSAGTQFSNRDIIYHQSGKIYKENEKLNSENSWMANNGSIVYQYDNRGNLIQIQRPNATSYFYEYNGKGLITNKKVIVKLDEDKIETYDNYIYTYRK